MRQVADNIDYLRLSHSREYLVIYLSIDKIRKKILQLLFCTPNNVECMPKNVNTLNKARFEFFNSKKQSSNNDLADKYSVHQVTYYMNIY